MTTQFLFFTIFAVAMYFIISDENNAAAFYYVVELVKTQIRKKWWWITQNPQNPIVKYMMWRRSMKMAKRLRAQINKSKET